MSADDEEDVKRGQGTAREVQKAHLSKLMAQPDKPVVIPELPKAKNPIEAPDFVRFYMGSSAGAGSEVFHVYRHLRRKETMRVDWIDKQAEKEDKDLEFVMRLAAHRAEDEERTAKKRAKRLKRKKRQKGKKLTESKQEEEGEAEEEGEKGEGEEGKNPAGKGSDSEGDTEEPHFVIGGR